jgi:hypothetical protein
LRLDSGEQSQFHVAWLTQDLEHQIGTDITRAQNGNFDFAIGWFHSYEWP